MSAKYGGNEVALYCSFCQKSQHEVRKLIAGPNVHICDECIELCNDILTEERQPTGRPVGERLRPHEIVRELDQHVIGQDEAKRTVAVGVYDHVLRLEHHRHRKPGDVEIAKSNILLIGPTGSGKTLIAQTLARLLNVPFAMADATKWTEVGFVGGDAEDCVKRLLEAAGGDVERAKRGIIFIDECDKLAGHPPGSGMVIRHGASDEGVQGDLLKIIEGDVISVAPRGTDPRRGQGEAVTIDTTNILFILGGAFDGIDGIIRDRTEKSGIGFGANIGPGAMAKDDSRILHRILPEDIVKYGFMSQFVGRFPVIAVLDPLTEEALVRILLEPKNALAKQYAALFAMDKAELVITPEAARRVASLSLERKTGARALRSILERVLQPARLEIPKLQEELGKKKERIVRVIVDDEVIAGGKKPAYEFGPLAT